MPEESEWENRNFQTPSHTASGRDMDEGWPEAFERRETQRDRVAETVELVVDGERVPVEVENSNQSGVFVRAETDLTPGQLVSIVEADEARVMQVVHVRPVPRSLTGCCLAGAGLRGRRAAPRA